MNDRSEWELSVRRRGIVLAQTAIITSTLGIGVAALAIDTGMMFSARSELQTAADAAALAAADALTGTTAAEPAVRARASEYAEMNPVQFDGVTIDPYSDVVLGHGQYDSATGKYTFIPGQTPYDAVQVVVRRDASAADGPVQLMFSRIFSTGTAEIGALATAMLTPRDISVVVDASGTMNDDSELFRHPDTQINLRDVWAGLDGPPQSFPYGPPPPGDSSLNTNTGPTIGAMGVWGDGLDVGSYDATTDPGLLDLEIDTLWTDPAIDNTLVNQGLTDWERWSLETNEKQGYATREMTDGFGFKSRVIRRSYSETEDEITIFLSSDDSDSTPALSHLTIGLPPNARSTAASTAESQGNYEVAVAGPDHQTGFSGIKYDETEFGEDGQAVTEWFRFRVPKSSEVNQIDIVAKAGPSFRFVTQQFEQEDATDVTRWRYRVAVALGLATWRSGMPGGTPGGDGDSLIESESELDWLAYPAFRTGNWTWNDFIDYVADAGARMASADSNLQNHYGLKTFANFLLETQAQANQSALALTPAMPFQAVRDSLRSMSNLLSGAQADDQTALHVFGDASSHELDLTDQFAAIPNRLDQMQASHYSSGGNFGGGLQAAIDELTGSRARSRARHVILFVTNGRPNMDQFNQFVGEDNPAAVQWALDRAQAAADNGIQIFTVAIGDDVNRQLTQQIAQIGRGAELFVNGTPDQYAPQLRQLLDGFTLERPVQLIQ
ncbi:MAG: vWA domain-containing protein [Phycisphaerae bacterium]